MRSTACSLFVAAVVFALYLFTQHPTVAPYRDSGDLAVAAATLGVAHPPGYPLYVMAGKLFTRVLPFANPAYRMNAFSALAGAAAVGMFLLALARIFPSSLPAACAAALCLAFSPALWHLSQVSEMYSLNAFLGAAILWCAAALRPAGAPSAATIPPGAVLATALLCGLAAANHQTIIFLYPGLIWYFWHAGFRGLKNWAMASICFFAGCGMYVFLPVRAATHPLTLWGAPDTLDGFLRLFSRADYGGMRLHPDQSAFSWTASLVVRHLALYARSLVEQFTVVFVLAGLWGIARTFRKSYSRFVLVSMLLSGPAFVIFSNLPPAEATTLPILEPHLVLPHLLFAFFIAAGLAELPYALISAIVVVAGLVVACCLHFPQCMYRNDYYSYDFGRSIMATAGKDAVVYDPDDQTAFITTYLQRCHGRRPDIVLAAFFRTRWGYEQLKNRHPDILPPREISSGRELAVEILTFNRGRRPVYAELAGKFPPGYDAFQEGLLCRLAEPRFTTGDAAAFERSFFRSVPSSAGDRDFFTRHVVAYYAAAHNNLGLGMAAAGRSADAFIEYRRALAIDPGLDAAYNNLGILAFNRRDYPAAYGFFADAARLAPDNPAPPFSQALCLKALGRIDEMSRLLDAAWQEKRYPDAGNELGLLALGRGDPASAERLFRAVRAAAPGHRPALYNLGLALKMQGRTAESRSCFEAYRAGSTDAAERAEIDELLRSLVP